LGLPLTIKARGDIHYWSTRPRALAQIRDAARQAAGLLSVSAALKTDMASLDLGEEKIRVHYTGSTTAGSNPSRAHGPGLA
jgi:hypothetical protein